eukprot:SAG31_NODE_9479_length_1270_cov_2.484202_2_plen_47_part_01
MFVRATNLRTTNVGRVDVMHPCPIETYRPTYRILALMVLIVAGALAF